MSKEKVAERLYESWRLDVGRYIGTRPFWEMLGDETKERWTRRADQIIALIEDAELPSPTRLKQASREGRRDVIDWIKKSSWTSVSDGFQGGGSGQRTFSETSWQYQLKQWGFK